MTVQNSTARNDYTGNGVTQDFPVSFRFLQNSHLQVLRTVIATNVTTVLALDSLGPDGFSVSGAGQPSGGAVHVNTPPALATERLSILRNMPFTQNIDYISNDPFPAESHERGLDERTMENQQLREVTARAITLPPQTAGVSTNLPAPKALNLLRWNASENALENVAPPAIATVADGAVVDATVSPIAAINAGKLAFTQQEGGALTRTVQSKLRDVYSVKDFGAVGDGVADDTLAVKAAIAAVSPAASLRGARIHFPRGKYKLTDTLILTSFAPDNAINLELSGDGWLSTWLDFSSMVGSKDGILVVGDQQVTIRGFFIKGGAGTRDGIHLGRNLVDGGANNNAVSVFEIADVRIQSFGRDGLHHYNSYMGMMNRVYCLANGRDGFHGAGFHTSLTHITCYALDNAACGFNYNGIVYSTFAGCGSDLNQFGYCLSNARGVSFNSCGAEGNSQDGWFIFADQGTVDTSNPLMVQECYDVRGVALNNCSGYGNNVLNAGYAGLVRLVGTNVHTGAGTFNDGSPHTVDVSINNCDANSVPGGTKAIVTQRTLGGASRYTEAGSNYFPGGRTIGAGTIRRDLSLIGKSVTVTLAANQSIPTSVDTSVSWGLANDDIGGCWVIGTPTLITIPAALEGLKVVIKFQAAWGADNTGARQAQVFKNGAYSNPMPRAGYGESDFYNASAMCASPPVRVTAGDQFQLVVQQNTAANLNFSSAISFLSLEVVG